MQFDPNARQPLQVPEGNLNPIQEQVGVPLANSEPVTVTLTPTQQTTATWVVIEQVIKEKFGNDVSVDNITKMETAFTKTGDGKDIVGTHDNKGVKCFNADILFSITVKVGEKSQTLQFKQNIVTNHRYPLDGDRNAVQAAEKAAAMKIQTYCNHITKPAQPDGAINQAALGAIKTKTTFTLEVAHKERRLSGNGSQLPGAEQTNAVAEKVIKSVKIKGDDTIGETIIKAKGIKSENISCEFTKQRSEKLSQFTTLANKPTPPTSQELKDVLKGTGMTPDQAVDVILSDTRSDFHELRDTLGEKTREISTHKDEAIKLYAEVKTSQPERVLSTVENAQKEHATASSLRDSLFTDHSSIHKNIVSMNKLLNATGTGLTNVEEKKAALAELGLAFDRSGLDDTIDSIQLPKGLTSAELATVRSEPRRQVGTEEDFNDLLRELGGSDTDLQRNAVQQPARQVVEEPSDWEKTLQELDLYSDNWIDNLVNANTGIDVPVGHREINIGNEMLEDLLENRNDANADGDQVGVSTEPPIQQRVDQPSQATNKPPKDQGWGTRAKSDASAVRSKNFLPQETRVRAQTAPSNVVPEARTQRQDVVSADQKANDAAVKSLAVKIRDGVKTSGTTKAFIRDAIIRGIDVRALPEEYEKINTGDKKVGLSRLDLEKAIKIEVDDLGGAEKYQIAGGMARKIQITSDGKIVVRDEDKPAFRALINEAEINGISLGEIAKLIKSNWIRFVGDSVPNINKKEEEINKLINNELAMGSDRSVWIAIDNGKLNPFVLSFLESNDAVINSNEIKYLKNSISEVKNSVIKSVSNGHVNLDVLMLSKGYLEDIKRSAISLNEKAPGTFSEEELKEIDASLKKIDELARRPIRDKEIYIAINEGKLEGFVKELIGRQYSDKKAELYDIANEILRQQGVVVEKMRNVHSIEDKNERLEEINGLKAKMDGIANVLKLLKNEINSIRGAEQFQILRGIAHKMEVNESGTITVGDKEGFIRLLDDASGNRLSNEQIASVIGRNWNEYNPDVEVKPEAANILKFIREVRIEGKLQSMKAEMEGVDNFANRNDRIPALSRLKSNIENIKNSVEKTNNRVPGSISEATLQELDKAINIAETKISIITSIKVNNLLGTIKMYEQTSLGNPEELTTIATVLKSQIDPILQEADELLKKENRTPDEMQAMNKKLYELNQSMILIKKGFTNADSDRVLSVLRQFPKT